MPAAIEQLVTSYNSTFNSHKNMFEQLYVPLSMFEGDIKKINDKFTDISLWKDYKVQNFQEQQGVQRYTVLQMFSDQASKDGKMQPFYPAEKQKTALYNITHNANLIVFDRYNQVIKVKEHGALQSEHDLEAMKIQLNTKVQEGITGV